MKLFSIRCSFISVLNCPRKVQMYSSRTGLNRIRPNPMKIAVRKLGVKNPYQLFRPRPESKYYVFTSLETPKPFGLTPK